MSGLIRVVEHKSPKYTPRTYFNATSADITLALAADLSTAGERCTLRAAGGPEGGKYIGFEISKSSDPIPLARELYSFMKRRKAKTLNIAGNGIYTLRKYEIDQDWINEFTLRIIEKIHKHIGLDQIYTGGQTGVDLAGAVSASYLGIPALITLPRGYIQRFEEGKDVSMSKESVELQIQTQTQILKERVKVHMSQEVPDVQ